MKPKLIITVDTEALPKRASENHIEHLIWGRHPNGTAGLKEICDIVESHSGSIISFLDVAGSFKNISPYEDINRFLINRGHDVQWHYHPEILGKKYWIEKGLSGKYLRQDLFDENETNIVLNAGLAQFKKITGRHPNAYRSGSFRWTQHTINFLAENKIPLSFNACAETAIKDNYNTFIPESPKPFKWPNGVIEIPAGEARLKDVIVHFSFPRRLPIKGLSFEKLATKLTEQSQGFVNILLHSWSLLSRDKETGFFKYESMARADKLNKLLTKLSKNFEIVGTNQLMTISHFSRLEESNIRASL